MITKRYFSDFFFRFSNCNIFKIFKSIFRLKYPVFQLFFAIKSVSSPKMAIYFHKSGHQELLSLLFQFDYLCISHPGRNFHLFTLRSVSWASSSAPNISSNIIAHSRVVLRGDGRVWHRILFLSISEHHFHFHHPQCPFMSCPMSVSFPAEGMLPYYVSIISANAKCHMEVYLLLCFVYVLCFVLYTVCFRTNVLWG